MANDNQVSIQIAAQTSGAEKVDALSKDLAGLEKNIESTEGGTAILAKLRTEIEALGQRRAAIDNFKELKLATAAAETAFQSAQAKAQTLGAALSDTATASAAQKREFALARTEVNAAETAWQNNVKSLQSARIALAESGVNTKNLAAAQADLKTDVAATTAKLADLKTALATSLGNSAENAKVAALVTELRALSGAIDPASIARAASLHQELEQLGGVTAILKNSVYGLKATSEQTGLALEQAFKTLGVRSVQQVEAEIASLRAAMQTVRNTSLFSGDMASATDAFKTKIAALENELKGLPAATSAAAGGISHVATAAGSAQQQVSEATSKVAGMVAAFAGINSLGDVAKNVITTGAAFETLRVRLEQLLGSQQQAAQAFDMIKTLAASTPFEVTALTESFAKLTTFGLQPNVAQMRALADTAAAAGGGQQMLERVSLALGQAWAKQKLQGDEILQLVEAGVPVWDLLAKATGKNVTELQAMSEAGTLGRDVMLKLWDAMGEKNAGASQKLMRTFSGTVSNAKDAMAEFFDLISRSGVLDYLTKQIQTLLTNFEQLKANGTLDKWAKDISLAVTGTIDVLKNAVSILSQFSGVITHLIEAKVLQSIIAFGVSLTGLGAAGVTAATGVAATGVAATGAGAAAAIGSVGVRTLAAAMTTLKTALPLGALLLGLDLLADKFFAAKKAADEGDAAVAKMLNDPGTGAAAKATGELADAAKQAAIEVGQIQPKTEDLIKSFDALKLKGDSSAEAIGKIGKDFDLASIPGIRDAASVLQKLADTGKLTANQVHEAWSNALKNVDLAEFTTRAKAAFSSGETDAKTLTSAIDAGLREAVKRSGLDFDVISGAMGKAAQSAIKDTDSIIAGLDRLKAQGVDTAAALTASLGKGINTADSQKAIEEVRLQIEQVRKALGDKVADGLLEQATAKARDLSAALDQAKPGINSLAEAMKALGVTSDQTFKDTAAKSAAAYQAMKDSGTASLRELTEGFKKYATDAIAANGGVASESLKAEAAMRGLQITADATGKSIVSGMNAASDAVRQLGADAAKTAKALSDAKDPFAGFTKTNSNGDTGTNTLPIDKAWALREKVRSGQMFEITQAEWEEAKKQADAAALWISESGMASPQAILDARDMQRAVQAAKDHIIDPTDPNAETAEQKAKAKNSTPGKVKRDEENAAKKTSQTPVPSLSTNPWQPAPGSPISAKSYDVNITLGGNQTTIHTNSDADAQALIAVLQRAKLTA